MRVSGTPLGIFCQKSLPKLTKVIDYQFIGADGATTTTDSTGHTTASGLGVVDGGHFAYISSNRLLFLQKRITIDNGGALSPFLSFSGDFEIEFKQKYSYTFGFYAETILEFKADTSPSFKLNIFADGTFTFGYSSAGFDFTGSGVNVNAEQTFKLERKSGIISLSINGILRGSIANAAVINAGRLYLSFNVYERYVDYLTVKKV